ncbi:MAG: transposase [Chlamydiota bacterium]
MNHLKPLSDSDASWQLTKSQWDFLASLFSSPSEKRGRGQPRANMRDTVNTVLYVHCTKTKWEAIPQGEGWAKKTTANRWMQIWKKSDFFSKILNQIKAAAPEIPEHPVSRAVLASDSTDCLPTPG